MKITLIAIPMLLLFSANSSASRCLEDELCAEQCAMMSYITGAVARQSSSNNITAKQTERYRSFSDSDNEAIQHMSSSIVRLVDGTRGKLTPSLVDEWASYGYCRNYGDNMLLDDAFLGVVENACSTASEDEQSECVRTAWLDAAIVFTQIELDERGYNIGPIDGIPGKKTYTAILEYKIKNDLPRDSSIYSLDEFMQHLLANK